MQICQSLFMKRVKLLFILLFSTAILLSTNANSKTIELVCIVDTYGTTNGVFDTIGGKRTFIIDIDENEGKIKLVVQIDKSTIKRHFKIMHSSNSFWYAIRLDRLVNYPDYGGMTTLVIDKINNRLSYANHMARRPQSYSLHYGDCYDR